MKRALPLLCVFISCWGPLATSGTATRFIGAQSQWVQLHSTIVQDGVGFDAIMMLKGRGRGSLCSAVVNDLPDLMPSLCEGQNARFDNGVATRELR